MLGLLRCMQELKVGWRVALATVIGFLGSAFGTVGGVGGGGIFVPMLTLIVGFDTKSAAALSKCNSFIISLTFYFLFNITASTYHRVHESIDTNCSRVVLSLRFNSKG